MALRRSATSAAFQAPLPGIAVREEDLDVEAPNAPPTAPEMAAVPNANAPPTAAERRVMANLLRKFVHQGTLLLKEEHREHVDKIYSRVGGADSWPHWETQVMDSDLGRDCVLCFFVLLRAAPPERKVRVRPRFSSHSDRGHQS